VYGDTVVDREELDSGDEIVGILNDEDSANLVLPDRVVIPSDLGDIAIIGLK
jgi:hypothetical protein